MITALRYVRIIAFVQISFLVALLVSAGNQNFSPATGVFKCSKNSNWGDLLLLNERAAQDCRVVIHGFHQNGIDSKGSVLFASGKGDATMSLACMDGEETAIGKDLYCDCDPINEMGEGCEQGSWKSGDYDNGAPPIAQKWPTPAHWKTTYVPATGNFTCSMVVGDVCSLNPEATRTCNLFIDGFSYQLDTDWAATLTSTVPNATLSVDCFDASHRTAIQCEKSCICEPLSGRGCNEGQVLSHSASLIMKWSIILSVVEALSAL
jgi:hypothetical protein